MLLSYLKAHNLRAIVQAELEPAKTLNLLVGPNGSGKTSFLEGIYFLATGRGFRGGQSRDLIRRGSAEVNVIGRQQDTTGLLTQIGVERSAQERRISINGVAQQSAAELVRRLPVVSAAPNDHHELFQSMRLRRAVLDWLVFHVEPRFFPAWGRYQKALRQRNAELRARASRPEVLAPWEREMDEAATTLQDCRASSVVRWSAALQASERKLLDGEFTVDLAPGWDTAKSLEEVLRTNRERDRGVGYTQFGPHRADLCVRLNGIDVRSDASHGQRKLAMFALRLAQLQVLHSERGRSAIVLVDDLGAELDPERRRALGAGLQALAAQVFVTATEPGRSGMEGWSDCKLFHVERGTIKAA